MKEKGWQTRSLTSLLTLAGFLIMSLTGLVLYLEPHGRVAYWTRWRFLGLTKDQWDSVHILASLLFIVAGAWHLYFNWKPLLHYLSGKAAGALRLRREVWTAAAALVFVVLSALYSLPPLSYLLDLNQHLKGVWVISPDYEPPFGHAELLSLAGFCRKMDIPLPQALSELGAKGVKFKDARQSLEEIARANNLSAMSLYALIKHLEPKPEIQPQGSYTPEQVEEKFAGQGLGRKTWLQVCQQLNLDLSSVRARLVAKGVRMRPEETLKQTAEAHDLSPIDLLKMVLVD